MSTVIHRTPNSGRKSLFFQDIETPVSSRRSGGKFSTPGQAPAVSALWHESFTNSDLPPPPAFTLEDRSDISPESRIKDYSMSLEAKSDLKTPVKSANREFSMVTSKAEVGTSYALGGKQQQSQKNPMGSSNWWSPAKSGGRAGKEDEAKGSPVEGMVQHGALIMLPPPQEVVRPETKKNAVPVGNLDEEEWVTVYGFPPADTNLVLREFEKCGIILKHVPGPREANWMHILYQHHSDAQNALSKNGMQLNGVLIIGVKPVDPTQRQALDERLNYQGFMPLPLAPSNRILETSAFRASARPYYLQNRSSSGQQSGGTVARPAKSFVSKVMDLMFAV